MKIKDLKPLLNFLPEDFDVLLFESEPYADQEINTTLTSVVVNFDTKTVTLKHEVK